LLGGGWRARYQNREQQSDHTDPQLSADSHDALQYVCDEYRCVPASRARLCAGRKPMGREAAGELALRAMSALGQKQTFAPQ
jgi:hypothetical protein